MHRADLRYGGHQLSLLFGRRDDHICQVVEQTQTFYEVEMLKDAFSRIFFGQCAVDVGAHVGNHSLFFARVLGLKTIAFEPNPESFACLSENMRVNEVEDSCLLFCAAAGASAGRAELLQAAAHNSGMTAVEPSSHGDVELVALDDVLSGEKQIDLLKIDVEGLEGQVLRGAVRTLSLYRPLLYIEIAPENFQAVRAFLEGMGYVCWKRFNATPTFLFLPRERLG